VTLDITNPNAVQLDAATAFLEERFGGRAGSIEPLKSGAWSTAYAFTVDGDPFVIRFNAHLEDFVKDRLIGEVAPSAMKVPRIIEIGEAHGMHYAISHRVMAGFIDDLDPAGIAATLPSLLTALDAARELTIPGTTGYGGFDAEGNAPFTTWRDYLLEVANDPPAPRGHGWRRNLEQSAGGAASFDAAFTWFASVVDDLPTARHLLHCDLLNYNVLVDGHELAAMIDWGCGTWGDFVYDIAWTVYCWKYHPEWSAVDPVAIVRAHYAAIGLDVPDFETRLLAYLVHIGLGDVRYSAYIGKWDQVGFANRLLDSLITQGRFDPSIQWNPAGA
jgi:hygromycin-B 4-O-kinase